MLFDESQIKMKHFLFIIVSFLFFSATVFSQIVTKVNPVNLSILLMEQPSMEKMKSTCEYYNLSKEPEEGGFEVYSFPDGSRVEFKVEETEGRRYPTVKVITKEKQTSISKNLSDCGYRKTSDGYVKGSKFEHRRTRCRVSGSTKSVLTFTKEYNSLE